MRALAALALSASLASAATTFFVSPSGSDSNPGTSRQKPFQSLETARSAVRSLLRDQRSDCDGSEGGRCPAAAPGSPTAEVVLLDGTWTRQASGFSAFELSAEDSGPSPSNPVVWRADNPGKAVISGGLFVPKASFKPWSGGAKGALVADIAGAPDTGTMVSGGLKDCQHNMSAVYLDGASPYLARWPNVWPNGTWRFEYAVAGGSSAFVANSTRPLAWAKEAAPALHGYWFFGWWDTYTTLTGASAAGAGQSRLTFSPSVDVKAKARFYGVNLLSELDDEVHGEFYFDRAASLLYLKPPAGAAWEEGGAWVSFADTVVSLRGASHVNLTGLTVRHGKGTGVSVVGGDAVWLSGVESAMHGANCTYIAGTTAGGIVGGSASDCGCMGVSLVAGDSRTLAAGSVLVQGATITRMGRWKRTYQAGLFWGGVGNVFRDLDISHGPHNGVLGGGNEAAGVSTLFENVTISHVASEVSDSGAFYTCGQAGQGWINPNVTLRGCTFRHIRNVVPCNLGYPSVQAVYLDDMMSWHTIENCTFEDVQRGVLVGGGRGTTVRGNTFRNVDIAVDIDARGLSFESQRCNSTSGDLWKGLESIGYDTPPYSQRFPGLESFNDGRACVPEHSVFESNTWCGGTFTTVSPGEQTAWNCTFAANTGTTGTCPA